MLAVGLLLGGLGVVEQAAAQSVAWTARYNGGLIDSEACPGACNASVGKHSLAVDGAGNTHVAGQVQNGTSLDFRTIKYSPSGAVLWSMLFNGTGNGDDAAVAIALDASGNVVVTGLSWNGTNNDFRTIKYAAADGTELWNVAYAGPGNGNDHAHAVALDASGNAYVAGFSSNGTNDDYRTIKYAAADGSELWNKTFNGPGNGHDYVWALALDAFGNAYVTGRSSNGSNNDFRTIKYAAADGNELWSAAFNGAGNGDDHALDIALDGSGNAYVTGESWNGANLFDQRTIKYASAGGELWSVAYTGPAGGQDTAWAVAVDGSGNAYVTGGSVSGANFDFRTTKYSAAGGLIWSVGYNSPPYTTDDGAWAIALDGSDNAIVTGWSYNGTNWDYRTVKHASGDGTVLWSAGYAGSGNGTDNSYAMGVDGSGNVYVTGTSWNGSNGDMRTIKYAAADGAVLFSASDAGANGADDLPGSGNLLLAKRSSAVDAGGNLYVTGDFFNGINWDYRTIKYSASGSVLWSVAYNGAGNANDLALALALDASGNAYVTGYSFNGANNDFRTIKYAAADGSVLWSVGYNGPADGNDHAHALALDSSGNAILTGVSHNGANWDYRTVSLAAADGSVLWDATLNGAGNGDDLPFSVVVDGSDNAYVTGYSFNGANNDYRTIKYSAAGGVLWSVAYNGPANGYDHAHALTLDSSGNAYVTGISDNGSNWDFRTIKYATADGSVMWSVGYDGSNQDLALAVAVDGSGNAYVTGYSGNGANDDYRTIKYAAADGSVVWNVGYNGPANNADQAYGIALDGSGNALVTGSSSSGVSNDYRTIKYASADGTALWSAGYDGAGGNDVAYSIVAQGPAVYVTGYAFFPTTAYDFLTVKYWNDTAAPSNPPSLTSTTHPLSTWSNLGSIGMQWSGAADDPGGSGLAGYSLLFDAAGATVPDTTVEVAQGSDPHSIASALLTDGTSHYFHLRTCDQAGNCSAALHSGPYWIDRTDPGAPVGLTSSSHATGVPTSDTTIDISWSASLDPLSGGVASGIDGYSILFDANASPACDLVKDVEEGTLSASSAPLADGTWYAHVCAVDNAGNWSPLSTAGPFMVETDADLSITKTDGTASAVPGQSAAYAIVVSNGGTIPVTGAAVSDVFPAACASVSWTCVAGPGATCTASGSANIADSVSLPAGGSVTYTATCNVSASATGTLVNTATVSVPSGINDPTPANNSATDSDTLTPQADTSVTLTDAPDPVTGLSTLTYTITVANAGPSDGSGLSVVHTLPSGVTFSSAIGSGWSCSMTTTVNCSRGGLAAGASAPDISVQVTVGPAGATLNSSVTASAPESDPSPANNTASAQTTVNGVPYADLTITVADGGVTALWGRPLSYTLTVTNDGPDAVTGASVSDSFPAGLGSVAWTCSASAGSSCTAAGSGNISDTAVNLLSGGTATYSATGVVIYGTSGPLSNTATVSSSIHDPLTANNSSTVNTPVDVDLIFKDGFEGP